MIPVFDLHADVFMDLVRRHESRNVAGGARAAREADTAREARAGLEPAPEVEPELEARHLSRMREGGIFGAVLTDCRMAGESAGPEHLERFIAEVNRELSVAENAVKPVVRVRAAADLERAKKTGAFAAIVGYEGLAAARGDLSWIGRLHDEADLRVAVLTHNDDNAFGGGALGARDGLTEKGREAVALMNGLGVLADMAHAGKKTRRDILETSARPVMLSHTSCKSVYDNGRNLSDEELCAIADKGGLVGCMTSPAALAPMADRANRSLERYVAHLLHMIDAAGVDHVGLGLHFCEYLYTREEYPLVEGLEDASRTQAIVEALLDSGLSEDNVEKVAWKNFARVFAEAVG